MAPLSRKAAAVLLASTVVVSGCGGASEADRKACDAEADYLQQAQESAEEKTADMSAAENPWTWATANAVRPEDYATQTLGRLSKYAPDDGRLARAIDQARDDAQTVLTASDPDARRGSSEALRGSLASIQSICDDFGS